MTTTAMLISSLAGSAGIFFITIAAMGRSKTQPNRLVSRAALGRLAPHGSTMTTTGCWTSSWSIMCNGRRLSIASAATLRASYASTAILGSSKASPILFTITRETGSSRMSLRSPVSLRISEREWVLRSPTTIMTASWMFSSQMTRCGTSFFTTSDTESSKRSLSRREQLC